MEPDRRNRWRIRRHKPRRPGYVPLHAQISAPASGNLASTFELKLAFKKEKTLMLFSCSAGHAEWPER